jgi:exo-1,4-beta-D-glucosaminidase
MRSSRFSVLITTFALAILPMPQLLSSSAAQAAPAGPRPAAKFAPDAGLTTLGLGGWQVQSSATAAGSGQDLSSPVFDASSWLKVNPDDAGAPGTEIEALLQNGACPNVFYSDNMRKCFGYMTDIGPDTVPEFSVPWWFRTMFNENLVPGQHAKLIVNGVVGQADVWVNGTEVATQDVVQGDFTQYAFDVTGLVHHGANALAIEIYPNNPRTMFTLDNVDWTQIPPDNNTGIQFPVQMQVSSGLSLSNAHVVENNAADLSSSALTVKADVTNNMDTTQEGDLLAVVSPPAGTHGPGAGSIVLSQHVSVPPGVTQTVIFSPDNFSRLTISHPRLWWPYQMGGQPLYSLDTALFQNGQLVNSASETFGIDTVKTDLVGPSDLAPGGVLRYSINGKPFLVRGGGYDENLFLHYDARDVANQITLLKGMGINTLRLEGHVMPEDFYEQMDRAGILIDGGYQCCDAWQLSRRATPTQKQVEVLQLSALTVGELLRNHPSAFTFSWSDNNPTPAQEQVSLAGFAQADFQAPLVASAEYKSGTTLGLSGEKEGPYDFVPPSYWYDTSHSDYADDSSLTNVGGSWGFDSEQSAGDTVPTLDSMRRFMSPDELTQLWTNPSYNQYHANYESGTSGYAFGTLFNFDTALRSRYGAWSSLEQYVEEAQVQNYELTRAQFEAFIAHWNNSPTPATGTIYWQANKGWPTLLWSLYNSDYDEAGSYFGAEKANETVHALFATDTNTVAVDDLSGQPVSGLSVEAKVYALDGTVLDDQTAKGITLASQQVRDGVLAPKVPAATTPPQQAQTYFVELLLRRHGQIIDRNVYWESTQPDVVDWPDTEGNPQATMTQYTDLSALQGLPAANVRVQARTVRHGGKDVTTVTVTNVSRSKNVAFFLRADVRLGDLHGNLRSGDNQVLPIVWSDNDITLWPGESQTISGTYAAAQLQGASPVVTLSGWNVGQVSVPAH